jgi:hypothetical protein
MSNMFLAKGQIQKNYVQNVQCTKCMNKKEKELDFKHTLLDFT